MNPFVLDYCCLFDQLKLYCDMQKPGKEKVFRSNVKQVSRMDQAISVLFLSHFFDLH